MLRADDLEALNDGIFDLLFEGAILNTIAFSALCCVCFVFMLIALVRRLRKRWDSGFYVLLCASAFVWSLFSFLVSYPVLPMDADLFFRFRFVGLVLLPALLMLHIRLQVSYKELRRFVVVLCFVVPAFLILVLFRDTFIPEFARVLPPLEGARLHMLGFYIYVFVMVIQAYLLCFRVLYQMPLRTRRSTKLLLVSVTALALLFAMDVFWESRLAPVIPQGAAFDILLPLAAPFAVFCVVYPLHKALYSMPASDVIVTSREFIMKGLHTTVLVLNQRNQVLDWNRKDWGGDFPLPKPLFKEPFAAYQGRILDSGGGRVSHHNENILIVSHGDTEMHFLICRYIVGNSSRSFGTVVEFSEVTPVYDTLRYFEEIAHIDSLTGLQNRNAHLKNIQQNMKPECMPLLVIVGDLNRLKYINDIHGHILGDELIKSAADVISRVMPENATVARVGGDEFVLLVPNGSVEVAQEFISRSNALCSELTHEIFRQPSISWGYALMMSLEQSYNDVFAEADKMMYEYKKARVEFSSSGSIPEGATKPN